MPQHEEIQVKVRNKVSVEQLYPCSQSAYDEFQCYSRSFSNLILYIFAYILESVLVGIF